MTGKCMTSADDCRKAPYRVFETMATEFLSNCDYA